MSSTISMIKSIRFLKLCLLLCLFVGFLSSCGKEEIEPNENEITESANFYLNGDSKDDKDGKDGKDGDKEECFTVNYPVIFDLPEGGTQTISSDEELDAMFLTYKEEDFEKENFPTPVYPVSITIIKDDTTKDINGDDDFEKLMAWCYGKYDDDKDEHDCEEYFEKDCFYFIYPLTVVLPDGTTGVADDEDGFEMIIKDWYAANEESEEKPTFQYPIQIKVDEEVVDINSDEELDAAFEGCYDKDEFEDYEDCFTLNFPVDIAYPDGTTATADSDETLEDLVKTWYEANEDSEEDIDLVYPVMVTMEEDGSVATVEDKEGFEVLKEGCE